MNPSDPNQLNMRQQKGQIQAQPQHMMPPPGIALPPEQVPTPEGGNPYAPAQPVAQQPAPMPPPIQQQQPMDQSHPAQQPMQPHYSGMGGPPPLERQQPMQQRPQYSGVGGPMVTRPQPNGPMRPPMPAGRPMNQARKSTPMGS